MTRICPCFVGPDGKTVVYLWRDENNAYWFSDEHACARLVRCHYPEAWPVHVKGVHGNGSNQPRERREYGGHRRSA